MSFFWSKRFWTVASLLLVANLSLYVVNADEAPSTVTVATWNLEWYFDHLTGDNYSELSKEQSAPSQEEYEWKRDRLAESIAEMKPTILAVQEIENRKVMLDLTTQLRNVHGLNYRVAFIEGFDMATEQDVAILYRSGMVEFSRREQSREMFESNEFYNLSKHIFAKFEWQAGGKTESLYVLNVHLRARAEQAETRLKQAKLIRLWIQPWLDAGENVIVMGDLNIEDLAGHASPGSDLAELLGQNTPNPDDDLYDVLESLPEEERRTHVILDKQFDRILVSPSLLRDEPDRKDLVFKSAAVREDLVIRGSRDGQEHWDSLYSIPRDERDLSDHSPLIAIFEFK